MHQRRGFSLDTRSNPGTRSSGSLLKGHRACSRVSTTFPTPGDDFSETAAVTRLGSLRSCRPSLASCQLIYRALDLFCCAGGAGMGLHRAGFDVTGVDHNDQPNYPFHFRQANALSYPLDGFDFIWASPPCQAYSIASASQRVRGKEYADLIEPIRKRLVASGIPWVIENVPGSPIRADLILCGSQFNLRVIRHRLFECSFPIFVLTPPCNHPPDPVVVVGHGTTSWARKKNGGKCHTSKEKRAAMGIQWTTREELSQAIPPAYSEFIGRQAIAALESH